MGKKTHEQASHRRGNTNSHQHMEKNTNLMKDQGYSDSDNDYNDSIIDTVSHYTRKKSLTISSVGEDVEHGESYAVLVN